MSTTGKWCTYCRKDTHSDAECSCTRPANWKPDQSGAHDLTVFQCKLDKSKCDHVWDRENDPTHCIKCGQSFTAYAFMEMP